MDLLPSHASGKGNFKSSQIPGVIGYVDGTHVAIRAPAEDEHVFLNRKSFHSLNVMIEIQVIPTSHGCRPPSSMLRIEDEGLPLASPEARYTLFHVRARSTVERCIGLLKGRFRCLLKHRVLEYAPLKCGGIVHACIVLQPQVGFTGFRNPEI
ncbi:hypothetical protein J437_LFUL013872 [Ladona fulva]|uniref:DDE Tnp4 domain-containing protein n=1 Tax=Ladona fulva TaxID=123851 RepID=A0A8K0KH95_LADFU|nr:hypothetical protein J437_LFUL013872 [Ladona fulva]